MDNRFFVKLIQNKYVVSDKEANHLLKVRRAKLGDEIIGFTGDGYDYFLTITEILKNEVICKCQKKQINKAYNIDNITVYLAMLKNDALTTAIDNLAELNVKSVKLFKSDYSIAQIDSSKLDKLKYIAMQASKQCERADIMQIDIIDKLDIEKEKSNYDRIFFAYENATDELKAFNANSYAVIIGAEGGFSKKEAEYFSSFATPISLSKTILRAEVACVSAVSSLKAVER